MKPYRKILFATDLSPSTMPGFREAVDFALESKAELLVGYAYQPPNLIQAQSIAPAVYDEWNQNLRTQIEARLETFIADARAKGLRARTVLIEGSPNEAISEVAAREGVDLIIMGTHGRTGLARLFQGSVSAHVSATAHCPVMTVPVA